MPYDDFIPLPESTQPSQAGHSMIGATDHAQHVDRVTLILKGKKTDREVYADADALAAQPPKARAYLNRKDLVATYSPSSKAHTELKDFAKHFGLKLGQATCGGFLVPVSGPAKAMNAAFNIQLVTHRAPNGKRYHAPARTVHVPRELTDIVRGVTGFVDRPLNQERTVSPLASIGVSDVNRSSDETINAIVKRVPSQGVLSPDVAQYFYNWPKGLRGEGQNIAIVEQGFDFKLDLVEAYFETFFTIDVPEITFVSKKKQDDTTVKPPDYATESQLDLQVACPIAPDATYYIYGFDQYAQNDFYLSLVGLIGAATYDEEPQIDVMSISYGFNERQLSRVEADFLNLLVALSGLFGMTITASSGDSGAAGIPLSPMSPLIGNNVVPSTVPYVLSCGGTVLACNPLYTPRSLREGVWNTPNPQTGGSEAATGGGISTMYRKPGYQLDATIPISVNAGVPGISSTGRGVPDISSNGAQETGYLVFIRNQQGQPHPSIIGGTSAAAPLWAALLAVLNEGLGANIGFINPALYQLQLLDAEPGSEPLNPVIVGNNGGNYQYPNAIYYASPRANWSAACGLGTPDGTLLLEALKTMQEG